MQRFRNILAAVDLGGDDRPVCPDLSAPGREVVRQAIALAAESGARLVFYTTLDVSDEEQTRIARERDVPGCDFDQAFQILNSLSEEAAQKNVKAEVAAGFGSGWERILERVKDFQHDLVIAGTRQRGPLTRLLFGSTAIKLLRYAPCSVWIAKPQRDDGRSVILAAHDLTDTGQEALKAAASMARMFRGTLLVFHACEPTLHHALAGEDVTAAESRIRHDDIRGKLLELISELDNCPPYELIIREGRPDWELIPLIEQRAVDTVVMGMRSRTVPGAMFIGNTSERLLPKLNCSVLAVKSEAPVTDK